MVNRVIKKALAGAEDITWGVGTEYQIRSGQSVPITQINSEHLPHQLPNGSVLPVGSALRVLQSNIDSEQTARTNGDSNLQAQMTGNVPLAASAFSMVSWNDQVIENSITIPPNKNAWSIGPVITIAEGQSVTVSEDSVWSIIPNNN